MKIYNFTDFCFASIVKDVLEKSWLFFMDQFCQVYCCKNIREGIMGFSVGYPVGL